LVQESITPQTISQNIFQDPTNLPGEIDDLNFSGSIPADFHREKREPKTVKTNRFQIKEMNVEIKNEDFKGHLDRFESNTADNIVNNQQPLENINKIQDNNEIPKEENLGQLLSKSIDLNLQIPDSLSQNKPTLLDPNFEHEEHPEVQSDTIPQNGLHHENDANFNNKTHEHPFLPRM
jgi:hypothetical protein